MGNRAKLIGTFRTTLGIEEDGAVLSAAYRETHGWDSVAHMRLVSEIESAFDIMLDTEDVIGMSSFAKAVEILARYDVDAR